MANRASYNVLQQPQGHHSHTATIDTEPPRKKHATNRETESYTPPHVAERGMDGGHLELLCSAATDHEEDGASRTGVASPATHDPRLDEDATCAWTPAEDDAVCAYVSSWSVAARRVVDLGAEEIDLGAEEIVKGRLNSEVVKRWNAHTLPTAQCEWTFAEDLRLVRMSESKYAACEPLTFRVSIFNMYGMSSGVWRDLATLKARRDELARAPWTLAEDVLLERFSGVDFSVYESASIFAAEPGGACNANRMERFRSFVCKGLESWMQAKALAVVGPNAFCAKELLAGRTILLRSPGALNARMKWTKLLLEHCGAEHWSMRRELHACGLGLVQVDRLTLAARSATPALHRARWEVVNTHNAAKMILDFAMPRATPTSDEIARTVRMVIAHDKIGVHRALRVHGLPPNLRCKGQGTKNTKDESATLLTIAARRGDTKICRILLKAGADVNARKLKDGCTALRVAAQHKTVGTIRFLLDAGADPELPHNDGSTPLFIAAQNGSGPLVDALLAGGASAATPMNDGATPLFISSQGGHAAVVKTLLETLRGRQSVDATLTKGIQSFPLYIAAARDHANVVALLIKNGADVNKTTCEGATALYYAAQLGNVGSIRVLLDGGADINHPMRDGSTPLLIAAQKGKKRVVQILLERGADANVAMDAEHDNTTSLYISAQQGHYQCVQILLDAGADATALCWSGETPRMAARRRKQHHCENLLAQHESKLTQQH